MNPLFRLVLLLAAVIGLGGYVLREYLGEKAGYEARIDLDRIERTFDERAPAARELGSSQDYGDEMRGLLRWYFGALREHDNRFPDFKNHEQHWRQIEHEHATGRIKGPEFEAYQANHTAVEDAYKALTTDYDPPLSASSAGQHFDFWRIERVQKDGKPKIRLDFSWWGPQRKDEAAERADSTTVVHHLIVNAAVTGFDITLLGDEPAVPLGRKKKADDAPAQFHAEMHGDEPEVKIPDPDHYVDLFPANVVLGTYYLDLFPHEATHLHIQLGAVTRTVEGHELPATFVWDVPIKEDWKLAQGQAWEGATVETRDPDEEGGGEGSGAERPAIARGHR